MQGRSWKAALAMVIGLGFIVAPGASLADETSTTHAPVEPSQKTALDAIYTVKLELRIAGLGPKGCDVEVKPAHRGCSFETVKKHVERKGEMVVVVKEIKVKNADRDCTFAITIKEAGHPDRSERRGLRLAKAPGETQSLSCFLSSPSKIARAGEMTDAKRK